MALDAAFQLLYRRHQPRLQRVVYAVLLDRDEAADVVQETFLKLHRSPPPQAMVEAWLVRVALNAALSWRRRILRFNRPSPAPTVTSRTPERDAQANQGLEVMRRAWQGLPPLQRAAIALHVDQGFEPQAVAEALNITPNHARVSLHRALKSVRTQLASVGLDSQVDLALPTGASE